MFRFLKKMIHLFVFVGLAVLAYIIVVYPYLLTYNIQEWLSYLDERPVQFGIVAVIIVYYILVFFAFIEQFFTKKKSIQVDGKNGKIEVSLVTLEDISKTFLESTGIVKLAKPKVIPTRKPAIIDVDIECYKTDNLNEKLENINEQLNEQIQKMVGFRPKRINLIVSKINQEAAVETIVDEPKIQEVVKPENGNIEL